MAEAKLITRKGEVFTFSDVDQTCSVFSTIPMKDIIVSVKKLQENVNNKLTEIVNEEKTQNGQKGTNTKSEEDAEFEDDSEDDEPPEKKRKEN